MNFFSRSSLGRRNTTFMCERFSVATGQLYQPPLLSITSYRRAAFCAASCSITFRPPFAFIHFRTLPIM